MGAYSIEHRSRIGRWREVCVCANLLYDSAQMICLIDQSDPTDQTDGTPAFLESELLTRCGGFGTARPAC